MKLSGYIFIFFFLPTSLFAATQPSLTVRPPNPIQGDPIFISVVGTSTARQISFENESLGTFYYLGQPSAIYGFDLNKKAGVYSVSAKLSDGSTISKKVLISARVKDPVTFTIPAKLGGNTVASQNTLVSTLADENAGLLGLRTGTKPFWSGVFVFPLEKPFITDSYGYTRATGVATVAHKGTDFRAPLRTKIFAINRGVARLVRETRNYGKTIVIDHGLGIMSMYMHLSRIDVAEGELVQKNQVIGLSGQTGYAENPHLHLSIRVRDISVDPIVFLNFFR